MQENLNEKFETLKRNLAQWPGVLVAFSGGADSTFLLAVSAQTLPRDRVLGVTAISSSFPEHEKLEVVRLAHRVGARHRFVLTQEMKNPFYTANLPNRCFFCKDELFQTLSPLSQREGLKIIDGFNRSDRSDFRPGYEAARQWNIAHPLDDTGFTKEDIRQASRVMNLPTWNKPASPCLSSRIAYGIPVTEEALRKIETAEMILRNSGFRTVRVRHLGEKARVEVGTDELPRIRRASLQKQLEHKLKALGYAKVVFDLEGYRPGRLNEALRAPSA